MPIAATIPAPKTAGRELLPCSLGVVTSGKETTVGVHRLGDVFHLLLAEIDKSDRQFRPDLIPCRPRDADVTGFRKSFQPSRNVNGITEKIVALHHNVADVDSDAEPHLLTGRSIHVLLGYGVLHRDCTLHGVHGAGEIGKNAVSRCVEDPTAMRGY